MWLRMILPLLLVDFSIATLASGFYLIAAASAAVAAALFLIALMIPDAA